MLDSYNRLACLLNSIQYFNPRTTFNVVKYKKAQNFIREGYILLTLVSNNNEQTSAYQLPQYIYITPISKTEKGVLFFQDPHPSSHFFSWLVILKPLSQVFQKYTTC